MDLRQKFDVVFALANAPLRMVCERLWQDDASKAMNELD